MSGLSDKISGEAKQVAGKVTDNKKLQVEGKVEKAKGEIKEEVGKASDRVRK